MINIFIEVENTLLLLDNKKCPSLISLSDGIYSFIAISTTGANTPILTTLEIKNNALSYNENYHVAKIDDNNYYLYFTFAKFLSTIPQPISYYQECINLDAPHYFTAYQKEQSYFFTLESENEIYNICTSHKLSNLKLRYSKIIDGFLIIIHANMLDKKYINIIVYDSDYHSIFSASADDIIANEHSITLTDYLFDSLNRQITREFTFINSKYEETKRSFIYHKTPSIIDKTIPYLFLEALYIKDYEYCLQFTSQSKLDIFIDILSNYSKIAFIPELYRDCSVYLLYNKENRSIIKRFDFDIQFNKIENIIAV